MPRKSRPPHPRDETPHSMDLLLPLLKLIRSSANLPEWSEALSGLLKTWLGCSSVRLRNFQGVCRDAKPSCLQGLTGNVPPLKEGSNFDRTDESRNGSSFADWIGRRLLRGDLLVVPGMRLSRYGSLRIANLRTFLKKNRPSDEDGWPLACRTDDGSGSIMFIPLRHMDLTFGLIEAVDGKSNYFTARSLGIVEEIARLLARTLYEDNREERSRAIFDGAAVGLVEQDFSAVKGYIDLLSRQTGDGLLEYFDKNPDGVAQCTDMVVVRDANRAAIDMYGATTKRDLILNYRSVFTEESLQIFKSLLIALWEGQARFHGNTACRNLKGELKQLSLVWHLSPGDEKDWSRIICSVEDTTERMRAVDRLHEQLLFFQTLIDTVPTPIFYKDTEQRYLGCNKAFEVYSRTTRHDIVGKTVFDLLGDTRKARIHHVADGELLRYPGKRLYESSIERPDGKKSTHIHRKATFVRHDGTSAGIVGVILDITEQKVAEDRLRKSQEELRNLSRRLQYVREEERKAISREIHDQLGQTLTVLQMELALLAKKMPSGEKGLLEKARQLKKRVREAIEIVRSISARTRPEMLDDLGLAAAIEWQVSEFRNLTGLTCSVSIDQTDRPIEADLSTALFRILQEALTNVWRHAHATEVRVFLTFQEDCLVLEVQDNGKGITERQANDSTSTGLIGMRERVYPWAGQVGIQGLSNSGTTVRVTVPLKMVSN
ncbi:MAG TPA: hypothetical protein DCR97_12555 [Deltaproteobacteria bacterium]|nr:hypothetical protein [Deltaproteobacteria bacterium]